MEEPSTLKGNYPNSSNTDKLMVYKQKLQAMERLMDTVDKREFSMMLINQLESDLRQVIIGIRDLREHRIKGFPGSIEAILASLRRAQEELYIASEMLELKGKSTESRSRSFYKCLSNFQDYLFEALHNFN